MRRLVTLGLVLVALALAAQPCFAGKINLIYSKTDSIHASIMFPGIKIAGYKTADSTGPIRGGDRNTRYWAEIVHLASPNAGGTDTTARFAIQMRGRDPVYPGNDTLAVGIGARKTLFNAGADANPPLDSMTVITSSVAGTDSTLAWHELGAYAPYIPSAGPGFTVSRVARVDFENAITKEPWVALLPEFRWRILSCYRAGQQPAVVWYRINIYAYSE